MHNIVDLASSLPFNGFSLSVFVFDKRVITSVYRHLTFSLSRIAFMVLLQSKIVNFFSLTHNFALFHDLINRAVIPTIFAFISASLKR